MKDGGVIVLVGCAKGGLWRIHLRAVVPPGAKPRAIIERLREDFVLGGHKAAAIALVEERADIYLVSDWPDEAVRGLFMTPFPNAQAAFDAAVQRCGSSATVIAMPYGGSTLPGQKPETARPFSPMGSFSGKDSENNG